MEMMKYCHVFISVNICELSGTCILLALMAVLRPIVTSAKEGYVFVVVCLFVSNFAQKLPNGFA